MTRATLLERRHEPRRAPEPARGWSVDMPGGQVYEVVDQSPHGLCCRVSTPVAPGRPSTLRLTRASTTTRVPAYVVRCEVSRVTADRIEYRVAWRLEQGWPAVS